MLVFILRRLFQALLVMLTVSLLAFILFRYIGDPVTIMLGQDATEADRMALRAQLGLDQPAPVQFYHFIVNAIHGEFGLSLRQGQPVIELLKNRLPATTELSVAAALLALIIGLPLGVYIDLKRNTLLIKFILCFFYVVILFSIFFI